MKVDYVLFLLLCSIQTRAQKIEDIQHQFNVPNKVYVINKTYDLKGDTLRLPEQCTLSFKGGTIKNGTVLAPYGKSACIEGSFRYDKANYFGDFYTKDKIQLTYRLDSIKRTFKLYHPFAMSYTVKNGIDAYHLSGAQGAFIIYHLQNRYRGKTMDSISLFHDDCKYVKDNDKEIVDKLVKPLIANRVDVVGLMFHCEGGWDDAYYSRKMAKNYQSYILHKVDLLKKYFPMMKIIYISNEQPWFTGDVKGLKNRDRYTKGWSDCLYALSTKLRKKGLLSGFKFAGPDVKSIQSMNQKLIRSVDYWGINLYPISGDENKRNLYSNYFINYYSNGIKEFMFLLKSHQKSTQINITETCCLPYRESIPKPWQYTNLKLHDDDAVTITTNMIRKILAKVSYKTESITYWFLSALVKQYNITRETMDRLYQGYLK